MFYLVQCFWLVSLVLGRQKKESEMFKVIICYIGISRPTRVDWSPIAHTSKTKDSERMNEWMNDWTNNHLNNIVLKHKSGTREMVCGVKRFLLLQRTLIQFLAPMSGSSQTPLTPVPGVWCLVLTSVGTPTYSRICTYE